MNNPSHAGQHANANDAVEAIETELGTDPSGSAATVKARLDARWPRIGRSRTSSRWTADLMDIGGQDAQLQAQAAFTALAELDAAIRDAEV